MSYYTRGRTQSSSLKLCRHKQVDVLLHAMTYLHESYIYLLGNVQNQQSVNLPGSRVDIGKLGEGGFKHTHN